MASQLDYLVERYEISNNGCWEWQGVLNNGGYGTASFDKKQQGAHRAVYEAVVGPIPDGYDLDHLCRNRCCVNPDHLEPVTRSENLRRGDTIIAQRANQTHCSRGHEFNEEHTYIAPNGCRKCKTCARMLRVAREGKR